MAYETYYAKRHIVVSSVPDFFMKTPVGFAVAVPRKLKHDKEDRVLNREELDALLDRHIIALQGKAHTFPDGLVHDVLHRDVLDRDFAIALASKINYGSSPGLVNFVYYASGSPYQTASNDPKIVFNASIVATSGYGDSGLSSETTILHRGGKPVLMIGARNGGGEQFVSDQAKLKGLQAMVLSEFADSLSKARRPCFVPHKGTYRNVILNPANAYKHL